MNLAVEENSSETSTIALEACPSEVQCRSRPSVERSRAGVGIPSSMLTSRVISLTQRDQVTERYTPVYGVTVRGETVLSNRRSLRIPVLAAVALIATASEAEVEERCNQLGSACKCSETLNVNEPVGSSWNPSNSTTLSCGTAYLAGAPGLARTVPATEMPPGIEIPNPYVLEMDAGGASGVHVVQGIPNPAFSAGTMCMRSYHKFSNNLSPIDFNGGPDRVKLMEYDISLNSTTSFKIQGQWGNGGDGNFNYLCTDNFCGPGANLTTGGDTVNVDDCKDSWCRVEMCITLSGGNMTPRARIAVLSTGAEETFTTSPLSGVSSITWNTADGQGDYAWMCDCYFQNIPTGKRYLSYALSVFWPTPQSASTWIGPASEIEGSGTPPLGPPAAPVLLSP